MTNWVNIANRSKNHGRSPGGLNTINTVRAVFKKRRTKKKSLHPYLLFVYVGRNVIKESCLSINQLVSVDINIDNPKQIFLKNSTEITMIRDFKFSNTARDKKKEGNSYAVALVWEYFEPSQEQLRPYCIKHEIVEDGIILHL